jgi:voltage-dependent potassium channel beta subunit
MSSMPHRMLGHTGLQVSVLSYGFWATFGVKDGLTGDAGVQRAKDCLRVARAGGINLFDNAEVYGSPRGAAESVMGEAIAQLTAENPEAWRRSDYLVSTKVFWGGDGVNEAGLSRKHVREGLEASLDRLQADYVDLFFCHRPDPYTPTETVVRAMTDAVRSGRAHAWGTSEWSAQQITEAHWLARTLHLEPPQFEQSQYNLFHRDRIEQEYHPLYAAPYNIGTTVWSPLMSGVLTGKYNDAIPEGSRLTQPGYEWLQKMLDGHRESGVIDKVRALTAFAKDELDCSMTELALAWVLGNRNVTTILLGATRVSQLEENLRAVDVARRMTPAHRDAIEQIIGNKPADYQGWGGAGMRSLDTL